MTINLDGKENDKDSKEDYQSGSNKEKDVFIPSITTKDRSIVCIGSSDSDKGLIIDNLINGTTKRKTSNTYTEEMVNINSSKSTIEQYQVEFMENLTRYSVKAYDVNLEVNQLKSKKRKQLIVEPDKKEEEKEKAKEAEIEAEKEDEIKNKENITENDKEKENEKENENVTDNVKTNDDESDRDDDKDDENEDDDVDDDVDDDESNGKKEKAKYEKWKEYRFGNRKIVSRIAQANAVFLFYNTNVESESEIQALQSQLSKFYDAIMNCSNVPFICMIGTNKKDKNKNKKDKNKKDTDNDDEIL